MDLTSLIAKLHPLERKVLPHLLENTTLPSIITSSGMKEIEITRALQWLENKEALKINVSKRKIVSLDTNGFRYQREGLPEKKFLEILDDEFKGLNVITKKSKLSREEVNACIGLLKRQNAIDVQKEEILQIKITEDGKKLLQGTTPEEIFLQHEFPTEVENLDKGALENLKKRKN